MTIALTSAFPTFALDIHHIYELDGAQYRFVYVSGDKATFSKVEDPGCMITYEIGTLNRLSATGKVVVKPWGFMPEHMRPVYNDADDLILASLAPAPRRRVEMRHAMVQGFLFLKENKAIKGDDDGIAAGMDEIVKAAQDWLVQDMPDPKYAAAMAAYRSGQGPKPKARHGMAIPDRVSPRALRQWVALYKRGGKKALIDKAVNQGNRFSAFSTDELALMAKLVQDNYMTLQRKTIAMTTIDVKRGFAEENERREKEGKAPLRIPGREAVRLHIKRLDRFRVLVARYGQKEAMKRMRAVKNGLENLRPFERVEMDEWQIDLLAILAETGLLTMFSPAELKDLGLTDERKRWWLVVAIDCRTRMIVGMTLTANPRTSSAMKCLNMVVSDKGAFADAVGALAHWPGANIPEVLAVDNGLSFKNARFTSTCCDLGIAKLQTIAGNPSMRARIERVFRTMGSTLMPRLYGRTFSNVLERGDHPAEDRACLTTENLATVLVRWVVDIYHNTPHEGLNGRTPLEQWTADMEDGNYPLLAAPTARRKRLAFGLPLSRKVQKDGIRIMNVRYHSGKLAAWFLKHDSQVVETRWLDENIGSIEVLMDGVWQEVPSVSETFEGVDASTWAVARRALRARDARAKAWSETVVLRAIKDIEALNATSSVAYKILDHAWSDKRMEAVEAEAIANFEVVEDSPQFEQAERGRGRVIKAQAPKAEASETDSIGVEEASKDESVVTETPAAPAQAKLKARKSKPAKKVTVRKVETDGDGEVWEFD